jgi:hypothetical protein
MNNEELSELINEDLKINISSPETEWEKYALTYNKWSELFIESNFEKNEAKAKFIYVEAFLSNDVRANYEKHNSGNKPTEAAIKNKVVVLEEYIKARRCYADLEKNTELLNSAVKALEYKKTALENLNK